MKTKKLIINKTANKKKDAKGKIKKKCYRRFQYTEEALKECLEKIKSKKLGICLASKTYNIPKTTILRKLSKNEDTLGKMGPYTVLSPEEEKMIVTWIIEKARIGYPMHPKLVKSAIQKVLTQAPRTNSFKNNYPGDKWFQLFLRRHPEVSMKHTEVLSKSRASVTEEVIRQWFNDLKEYLQEENAQDILDDPTRIFNMDETGVQLCPRTGKLLCESKEKNNYYISPGQEKENITVLGSYSADGKTIRPMILYPYKSFPPRKVARSVPEGCVIGHSPSGYMTSETFRQFIENGFYKQLEAEQVKFPVLLLFDGHKSHISLELHNFCKDKKILLYFLYPNATHILQPCDVAIFKPLKLAWRQVVAEHSQNSTVPINKLNFAPLFDKALFKASDPAVIKKAFECCGLYPFNPDAVNYKKCISTRRNGMRNHDDVIKNLNSNDISEISNISDSAITDSNESSSTDTSINILNMIESSIPKDILNMFNEAYQRNENPCKEVVLIEMWKKFKESTERVNLVTIEHKANDSVSNDPSDVCDTLNDQALYNVQCTETLSEDNLVDNSTLSDNMYSKYSIEQIILDVDDIPIILPNEIDGSTNTTLKIVEMKENLISQMNSNCSTSPEDTCKSSESMNSILPMNTNCSTSSEGTCNSSEPTSILEIGLDLSMNTKVVTSSSEVHTEETINSFMETGIHEATSDCHSPIPAPITENAMNMSTNSISAILETEPKSASFSSTITQDNRTTTEPSNSKGNVNIEPHLKELWKKELHFPTIVKFTKKPRVVKPKIFAITSEAYKKEQEEKEIKQIELEKVKALKKFEREVKRKIKQEQIEIKKQEKIKLQELKKLQEESIKKKTEEKFEQLLKQKAESLDLTNFDASILSVSKKRKIMKDVTNMTS